jgi:hypothetical protein
MGGGYQQGDSKSGVRRIVMKEASPITYVHKGDPPFLQILGDKDEHIPFSEATNLDAALRRSWLNEGFGLALQAPGSRFLKKSAFYALKAF